VRLAVFANLLASVARSVVRGRIADARPRGDGGPAPAPTPTVRISAAVSQPEGNTGEIAFVYTITRSATLAAVAVPWSFAAGGASAGDFVGGVLPVGGTVNMADGVATGAITITVAGDATFEGDESFTVSISAPAGYALGSPSSATGTILNDDAAPDTTAPTLSSPTDDADGVSTNEANGLLYWFVSTSATPPSAAALKAGTGAVAFGNQAVSATGEQPIAASGLTGGAAYYTYFLHRDAAGNDSAIASADGFTTDAPAASYTYLTDDDGNRLTDDAGNLLVLEFA
jgi:hypothetical protein